MYIYILNYVTSGNEIFLSIYTSEELTVREKAKSSTLIRFIVPTNLVVLNKLSKVMLNFPRGAILTVIKTHCRVHIQNPIIKPCLLGQLMTLFYAASDIALRVGHVSIQWQ